MARPGSSTGHWLKSSGTAKQPSPVRGIAHAPPNPHNNPGANGASRGRWSCSGMRQPAEHRSSSPVVQGRLRPHNLAWLSRGRHHVECLSAPSRELSAIACGVRVGSANPRSRAPCQSPSATKSERAGKATPFSACHRGLASQSSGHRSTLLSGNSPSPVSDRPRARTRRWASLQVRVRQTKYTLPAAAKRVGFGPYCVWSQPDTGTWPGTAAAKYWRSLGFRRL
jgi:hypothetical protein